MGNVHRRCVSCGHLWEGRESAKSPRCSACGSKKTEVLSKEEYEDFQSADAEYGGGMAGGTGDLQWDKDMPESPAPAHPPAPAPVAQADNKDLKEILKAVGRFDALARSLDTRLKAVEKMGNGAAPSSDAAPSASLSPPSGEDESMEEMYKSMASGLKMMMMKSMVESFQPKPAPVASQDNGQTRMLMDEIKSLKAEIGNAKNIEPQLVSGLAQQVESMRQEAQHRETQEILKAIYSTRVDPEKKSELDLFLSGMDFASRQHSNVPSDGETAYWKGQSEMASAIASKVSEGVGIADAVKDVTRLGIELKKNEMLVAQQQAMGGQPPRSGPVQEVPLDQVEADADRLEEMWNPANDVTAERMVPGLALKKVPPGGGADPDLEDDY